MQIFSGNNLPLSVDVHAPKPTTNAWHIDGKSANSKGVFTIGDEIKVTLTLNEKVTLANVGQNNIVIAGKKFLLTGTNGTSTTVLNFTYTVKANDKLIATSRRYNAVLTGILDTDGNSINMSHATSPIGLTNTLIDADFITNNKITQTNDIYEKTSDTGWNSNVASSQGFVNDGYVIAKIGAPDKRVMLGLSSSNTSHSYNGLNYALYADSGIGKKFVIYESGQRKYSTGVTYICISDNLAPTP
jgi:hypothetical protein